MNTQYTDTQLKQALAKMLPETTVTWWSLSNSIAWMLENGDVGDDVKDTELLHLCWLVEETLTFDEKVSEVSKLEIEASFTHMATWQQRVVALAKVKGIEI